MTRSSVLVSLVLSSGSCAAAHAEIVTDWVTVGDAGNAADTRFMDDGTTGYGSVGYEYLIGKYEVTNGQYIDFLNAVATIDTYGLYNSQMSGEYGGIDRNGTSGSYSYGAKDGDGNWLDRPVTYVSWYDTLRFANWLHNGQPTGAQNTSTTEDGAYTFSGPDSVGGRNSGATVFLPSEDEWYKAAYYKGDGLDAGYWRFPTQSDDPPVAEAPPGRWEPPGAANCKEGYTPVVEPPYFSSEVGAYIHSAAPHGTSDQAGNAWEWNEAELMLLGELVRGVRGSAWDTDSGMSRSYTRLYTGLAPHYEDSPALGFRVAAIPEPASALLLVCGTVALIAQRRGGKRSSAP